MNKGYSILIIDEVHPILLDKLKDYNVHYDPSITLPELKEKIDDIEIIILRSKLQLTQEWIKLAPKLKVIGRLGSGMDNIDVEFADKQGISCFNAPEGNRNAVAEQTLGMILATLSNTFKSSKEVREGIWDRKGNSGIELDSLTVGIIGYGNVGKQLTKKLKGFDCNVLAYDLFLSNFGDENVHEAELQEIFEKADIVTLHVPLNKYSYHMINSNFIQSMKKPFYLFNLSRGDVVLTSDLIEGLETNKIIACGLDVLENEKINNLSKLQQEQFEYLSDNERVILTPHIGGLTQNSFLKLAEILADKVLNWAKKEPLVN
ncbi:MAG: phosphoglycerate dehydrogenase [Bacteroidia bacterium]|nr:phosphoglycerate dehydrogenase [Bacteroidia bacterium]